MQVPHVPSSTVIIAGGHWIADVDTALFIFVASVSPVKNIKFSG